MNDEFLENWRRDPPPEFAGALRKRLNEREEPARRSFTRPALAVAAVIAAITALFAFPAVRASALAMLDLFRVRNFAAIPFDENRFEKLRSLDKGSGLSILDGQEKLRDSGPPEVVASKQAAATLAGIDVRSPSILPSGLALGKIEVQHDGQGRLTVHADKLRALLDDLDLRDVDVPAGLDGQAISVHLWPAVIQHYENGRRSVHLVQARSPEVGLPPGADLSRLGVIGLRILGLDQAEARRVAATIDWHSTLVVPVPMNASTFREVTVRGNHGLLVTTTGDPNRTEHHHGGVVVLWTEGDRVFALMGDLGEMEMMQMAESVQ